MEKGYKLNNDKPIVLFFPPSWIYTTGGTHIALPLLKSYLENKNIPAITRDLNIEVSEYYNLKITENDLITTASNLSLDNLNDLYYREQDKMTAIASQVNAHWEIQQGFSFSNFDFSSSEKIRLQSQKKSVFTEFYLDSVLPFVNKENPNIIGFSISVPQQLLPTFELCRLLREKGYDGKIILGGNVVSRIGDSFFLDWVFDLVDGLIVFQGEQALTDLYFAVNENKNFANIPNLIWRFNGKIVQNKIEYLQPQNFSRPDFSETKIDSYWGSHYLPILGSRGCYYGKCTFCAIPFGYGKTGFIGHDNSLNVFEDMKNAFSIYGIRNFKFMEEAMHPTIIKRLSELIIQADLKFIWEGYARFDSFWKDEAFLKKVSKAGLRKVYLGLELVNSSKRDLLNKSDTEKGLELLLKFKDAGIKTHVFTLFGYPKTGIDEAVDTIEFALKYNDLIDTLDIFPFYYAKHTTIPFVKPIIDKKKDWALEYDYKPISEEVLSKKEVSELCNQLEEVIWREEPKWLHPIYRLYSPWNLNF